MSIEWHTSGTLWTNTGNVGGQRFGWYSYSNGVPTVVFNGLHPEIGASPQGGYDIAVQNAYNRYWPHVETERAVHPKLEVTGDYCIDAANETGYVNVRVENVHDSAVTGQHAVHAVLYQRHITQCCDSQGNMQWHNIVRAHPLQYLTDTDFDQPGEVFTTSMSFPLNPAWAGYDPDDMAVMLIVQKTGNKRVMACEEAALKYANEVENFDGFVASIESNQSAEFNTQVQNVGAEVDDVVVTINTSRLPAGWTGELEHDSVVYPNNLTLSNMQPGQIEDVIVRVHAGATPGLGDVVVTSANQGSCSGLRATTSVSNTYNVFGGTPAILFVDDDRGESSETMFQAAVGDAGYFSLLYDFELLSTPDQTFLNGFDAVVWTTGSQQAGTIGGAAETVLKAYLDQGGSIYVSSQGLMNHRGLNDFTQNYLGVGGFSQDLQALTLVGVPSDPVGDGLNFVLTPPNPDFGDVLSAGTGTVWANGHAGPIGTRLESGPFRSVFGSFQFEGLTVAGEAEQTMKQILDWLLPVVPGNSVRPGPSASSVALALWQNSPNPFVGSTAVRYAIPSEGPVSLDIFNVAGQRVTTLVNQVMSAGEYTAHWDGRDASGLRVASGVYLYRLQAAGESLTKEMVHMK